MYDIGDRKKSEVAMKKKEGTEFPADLSAEPQKTQMTIYEYEEKYSRRQNARGARRILWILAAIVGILLFACLFMIACSSISSASSCPSSRS